jgi:DnaJ-class molecular chaperone
MSDYYEVLGVHRKADVSEIRSAYRRFALDFHPDRTQGDPESAEIFKLATEAYEILSNDEARASYDEALVGYRKTRSGTSVREILDGIGSVAGLFMEASARANPGKVGVGKCPVCKASGQISIDLGVIHLSKRCEACAGTGKLQPSEPVNVNGEQR